MLSHLLAWIRRLVGFAESRDVLRLPTGDTGSRTADVVREDVRRKGPLKPNQLRQIVRDERLMPKPPKRTRLTKPPKVMSPEQATRLFAGTLRTTNRELRTLYCDEAQLKRYEARFSDFEAKRQAFVVLTQNGVDSVVRRRLATWSPPEPIESVVLGWSRVVQLARRASGPVTVRSGSS